MICLTLYTKILRAGDQVTFVYGNIVSQQMFDISFKLLFIYIDHVPGKQILIPAV